MRRYETTFVVHPELTEEDYQRIVARISGAITQFRGEVLQLQDWGVKKLAYKIKKQTRGHYTLVDYAGGPEAVREVERLLKIDENVLRFLTVLVDEKVDVEAVKKELARASRKPSEIEEGGELQEETEPTESPHGEDETPQEEQQL